ncbi:MAG: radical SAM protein [Elusimicrobia bacterium]|nr:radical SAM protein [Candidatus Liberimonas magnetica]
MGKAVMVTFGWDLCKTCNYRCPYCGTWETSPKNKLLSPKEWGLIWERIYGLYGKCYIYISGGEPSTYPGFYELVEMLGKYHFPEICTNLSWDIDKLVPKLSKEQIKIAPTFHPSFADFEEFFKKVVKIKEYLPDHQVYYVAYPNQIKDMPQRSKKLMNESVKLIPLPLRGDGFVLNSEEEKGIIEELSPYKGSEKMDYQLNKAIPKGKLCRAGQDYAVIRTSGLVDRCSQYADGKVGNFLDKDFKLFDEPLVCEKSYCPIESQWIVQEK